MGYQITYYLLFLTIFLYLKLIHGDDLMSTRKKNNTARSPNRQLRNDDQIEESALSLEAAKFLKQCGGDNRNDTDTKSYKGTNMEQNHWERNGEHSNSNGDQQSNNPYRNGNHRDSTNQYPNYQDTLYHNKRTTNPGRNYGNDDPYNTQNFNRNPLTPNYNPNYSNSGYPGYESGNDQRKSQCGMDNNGNYGDTDGGYNNRNANRNDQNPYRFFNAFRSKRFNHSNNDDQNDDEDNECVSQCIFEYLQLLDDDRIPSESLFIKWLQANASGSDMDRIKNLREARLCFARLAATDMDDGCQFSKELAKCLNLNID